MCIVWLIGQQAILLKEVWHEKRNFIHWHIHLRARGLHLHLKVFNPSVDADRKCFGLPSAPRVSHNLNDLLQGQTHTLEDCFFVDPCRLAVWMSQTSLRGREGQKLSSKCRGTTEQIWHVNIRIRKEILRYK